MFKIVSGVLGFRGGNKVCQACPSVAEYQLGASVGGRVWRLSAEVGRVFIMVDCACPLCSEISLLLTVSFPHPIVSVCSKSTSYRNIHY